MTPDEKTLTRLRFFAKVAAKECRHLLATDQRLFAVPFTVERAALMETDNELAERVEAFIGRFGRLQDTLGDKFLPQLLVALGELSGPFIDNLDKAERLDLIASADDWLTVRKLRNQMVHEYVEDPKLLAGALQTGHTSVALLVATAERMIAELERRWG